LQMYRIASRFLSVSSRAPAHLLSLFPSRSGRGADRKTRRMVRSHRPWHLFSSPAGVVATLLALVPVAPSAARAGCSHFVTSQSDPARLPSLVGTLLRDLAVPSDPLPIPPAQRRCSGSWCSGQPAIPSVPAGTFEGRLGSWAWCVPVPNAASTDPSFLAAGSDTIRPLWQANDVFHPPRHARHV
jgi:hypothetical protein